jgi:hypothetical protein
MLGSNSFWDTFRSKRPNATLAESGGFDQRDQRSMIALASSQALDPAGRLRKGCRQLTN